MLSINSSSQFCLVFFIFFLCFVLFLAFRVPGGGGGVAPENQSSPYVAHTTGILLVNLVRVHQCGSLDVGTTSGWRINFLNRSVVAHFGNPARNTLGRHARLDLSSSCKLKQGLRYSGKKFSGTTRKICNE